MTVPSAALRAGAVALLVKGDSILLKLRDDAPLWCLPGGFADEGETPLQNLLRELHEELNVQFAPESFTRLARYRFFQPYNSLTVSGTLFHKPFAGEPVSLGNEGVKLAFFPLEQLPLNMFCNQRTIVQMAWQALPHPLPEELELGRDDTLDLASKYKPSDIVGYEDWNAHPRVLEKRAKGQLRFDVQ